MADYTLEETRMIGKYYGQDHLESNDLFWLDCLINYQDKIVLLPLIDDARSRRKLHDLLDCPPGVCNKCCGYHRVPLSPDDLTRLKGLESNLTKTEDGLELHCDNGCPFLKDSQCSIYKIRPDVCAEFPIQLPRESLIDGKTPFLQVVYRLKCKASLDVIKSVMQEACQTAPMILLPDLSLVPRVVSKLPNIKIPSG